MSMKRSVTTLGLILAAFLGFSGAFSGGPPAGVSGAPGENNCTLCHSSFALNSGSAQFTIGPPPSLVAGGTLGLTVGFANSSTPRHGFQITMRNANNVATGTWSLAAPTTTQLNGANHVNHTLAGVNQLSWPVNWTPPAVLPPGPITFYAAGNEANGNNNSQGDFIYTTSAPVYQIDLSTATAAWPLGSSQNLLLNAPGHAGEFHVVVLSHDPAPTPLGGPFTIPVNVFSPLTTLAWNFPSIFQNFVGTLPAGGTTTATVLVPGDPTLSGATVHFAFATVNAGLSVTEVSNRLSVALQ